MAGNRIVHRCKERGKKSNVAIVKRPYDTWKILIYGPDMNDYHETFGEYEVQALARIEYCPFCGKKLNGGNNND